jgi:hypothetical protein
MSSLYAIVSRTLGYALTRRTGLACCHVLPRSYQLSPLGWLTVMPA